MVFATHHRGQQAVEQILLADPALGVDLLLEARQQATRRVAKARHFKNRFDLVVGSIFYNPRLNGAMRLTFRLNVESGVLNTRNRLGKRVNIIQTNELKRAGSRLDEHLRTAGVRRTVGGRLYLAANCGQVPGVVALRHRHEQTIQFWKALLHASRHLKRRQELGDVDPIRTAERADKFSKKIGG